MAASVSRLNPLIWLGVPSLGVVVLTVLMSIPLRVFGFGLPEPVFAVPVLFGWALVRSSVLGPFAVIGLGIFLDVYWGGAPGLWPASLLVTYVVVSASRSLLMGQSVPVMWGWYALACAGCAVTAFLVAGVLRLNSPDWLAIFWQFLATTAMFPIGYSIFERFEDADVSFR